MGKGTKKAILFLSPFFVSLVALFIGAYGVSPEVIIKILLNELIGFDGELKASAERAIVVDIRLPRIIMAGLVGAALSTAGVTLQAVFRNPLVDPYILGISAGSAFGCAIAVGFFHFLPLQLSAFVFGILAVTLAYAIAKTQEGVPRVSLILAGVIVSAFFSALVSIVKFLVDPHRLQSIVFWLMGSFNLAEWGSVKTAFLGIVLGILPLVLMRWRLNVISLGDEEAKTLGINVERERLILVALSTLAVSVATSLCGIIGWVGLIVPHIIRMVIGPNHKDLLPLAIFGGASFTILADTIARSITKFDIPIGIITALSGAPFFAYLLRRSGRELWR